MYHAKDGVCVYSERHWKNMNLTVWIEVSAVWQIEQNECHFTSNIFSILV